MFDLFGKRKKDTDLSLNDKERALAKFCSDLLGMTYSLIKHSKEKSQDNFSLGYVWGFVDCMLYTNGYKVSDKAFIMMGVVFWSVFGKEEGKALMVRAFHLQESGDDTMRQGMMAAGKDIADLKNDKSSSRWLAYVRPELG